VLGDDGRLLPGSKASAGAILRGGRPLGRARLGRQDRVQWLWKGRRVYMFDGTTVSMSDTPENQAAYPQVYNHKPGLGFPIARIGVITSLACGEIRC
jgi:hypothetical protein